MLTKMKQFFLTVIISISLCDFVSAQKYSNDFLSIGVGAREQGMSGASIATAQGVFAAYWNVACLPDIEAPLQIGAMHAEWFAGVAKYDFIGLVKTSDNTLESIQKGEVHRSAFAINAIRLGIDQIPYTLNLVGADGAINYNNVSQFSSADYAFNLAYAKQDNNLSYGGNIKVIRRIIGSFASAWGVGIDLGVRYKIGNWRFAAVGKDISTTYNAWTATLTDAEKATFAATNNDIPKSSVETTLPTIFLGVANISNLSDKISFTTELDLGFATDGQRNVLISSKAFNIDPRIGFELSYIKKIYLRAGVGNFQRLKRDADPSQTSINYQPNFGVGLKLGRLQVDYALTNIGNVSSVLYSNIFSLTLNFISQNAANKMVMK